MQRKTLERCEGFLAGAKILGNWPESHAPPGGTRLAARCQRKDNGFVWLRSTVVVLGVLLQF